MHQIVRDSAPGGLAQAQAVTGVAARCSRPVFSPRGCMRQQRLLARGIVWEATGGQHDAAPGMDRHRALTRPDHGALHAPVGLDQAQCRAAGADLDTRLQSRCGQARHERVAVDQAHATPVLHQIASMRQYTLCRIPEGRQRAQGVHEMPQFRPGRDAHAPQGGFRQRTPQAVDVRTQAPAVERGRAHRTPAAAGMRCATMKVR